MHTIKISQIQFEAKSTPSENAKLLKKYFEKTKKFNPYLIRERHENELDRMNGVFLEAKEFIALASSAIKEILSNPFFREDLLKAFKLREYDFL